MARIQGLAFKEAHDFVLSVVGEDLHAKRVYSLANATQGVITSASLAVSTIGHGLAEARGLLSKHAIKQVDRSLSNTGIEVAAFFMRWVPYVVGARKSIEVAMDWTDFDDDKQATIMLSLVTQHGRATSLVWLTVDKGTLKHNRNGYEHTVLVRLAEALPADVEVLIVADRGFGDHKLYQVLTEELKFDYLIRFRGNIKVTSAEGETCSATDWVGAGGRTRILRGCAVTAEGYPVGVRWTRKMGQWLRWSSAPRSAVGAGAGHEADTQEARVIVQGEGGVGGDQGRPDGCRVGQGFWGSPEPDLRLEEAVARGCGGRLRGGWRRRGRESR